MARQQKSERQRAEEALAVARRKVRRLETAEKHQTELLELTRRELADARRLLTYRSEHPALQNTTTPKENPTT